MCFVLQRLRPPRVCLCGEMLLAGASRDAREVWDARGNANLCAPDVRVWRRAGLQPSACPGDRSMLSCVGLSSPARRGDFVHNFDRVGRGRCCDAA